MTTMPSTVQERVNLPAVHGAADTGGSSLTAGDLWTMLRRRTLLIVLLFVLFSAIAVGGFIAWWIYLPGYRSYSLIECISNIPEAGLTVEQRRLQREEFERFVLSQSLLIKSPSNLRSVLQSSAVRETQWWQEIEARASSKPNLHLIELTDQLSAAPVRGTNYLRVSMEYHNRKDPAVIVNEVVRRWYETVKKRSAEEFASEPLEAVRQEAEELDKEIRSKRSDLASIAARLPAGARLDPARNVVAEQVRQYGEQVAQYKLELAHLQQYRDAYNDPQGVAVTAEDRAIVQADPQIAALTQQLMLLEQQRAADVKSKGENHRIIKQLDAQIAATEAKRSQLEIQKLQERRADMREATETAYANTQYALLLAQENLTRAEAELQDQDRLLFDYSNLEAELEEDVKYRIELGNQIRDLTRVVRQQTAVNVNIAVPAIEPLEQSSPSPLLLPIGVFLAFAMSVGIGLGLEMLDTSVRTTQDITRHLDIAMLGAVPHTDDEEVAIDRVETAVRDAPRSMVAEAFRRIRTGLQFSAPAEQQRTVLVTSPRPSDGKTTVACNLAMAVAQAGRRVLLVDANFHRPCLQRIFANVDKTGFSNILIGQAMLDGTVQSSTIPSLDVLGAGPIPPNPAELLNGEPCKALLHEAAARYDQVIIDTSPVLLASDGLVLSPLVDGVILVVRAQKNSRGLAKRACTLLDSVGAHLFGGVLNAALVTRGGYFREQLRAYYDYQGSASLPAPSKSSGSESSA